LQHGIDLSYADRNDDIWEYDMGDWGFWPLVHLALWVYAAVQIMGSSADTVRKIIWVVVVALFPVVGLVVWFFIGPGTPKK
jgi:hypothetical protein